MAGWPRQLRAHSFAYFANEWALDLGKTLEEEIGALGLDLVAQGFRAQAEGAGVFSERAAKGA